MFCFFFFFQAEDGIRDLTVTGVQTCALPISEGLTQMQNETEIEQLANRVITENAKKFEDYRFGNDGIFKFLVGLGMKASKGRANAQVLNQKLKERHERAVGDSFFERYNSKQGTSYAFSRLGTPPEPDLVYSDAKAGIVGAEITSTYLNEEEAEFA